MWDTLLLQERLHGFCSIYAPNSSSTHSHLWDWMASSISYVYWTIGGDCSMLEWEGDRGGFASSVVCGVEKQAWSRREFNL